MDLLDFWKEEVRAGAYEPTQVPEGFVPFAVEPPAKATSDPNASQIVWFYKKREGDAGSSPRA